jgi:hypothetical protein
MPFMFFVTRTSMTPLEGVEARAKTITGKVSKVVIAARWMASLLGRPFD